MPPRTGGGRSRAGWAARGWGAAGGGPPGGAPGRGRGRTARRGRAGGPAGCRSSGRAWAFMLYTPGAPAIPPKEASMKFTWFNLMPWPYLPDDFREKNRSVWVDIPNTLYDPRKGHAVYHEYMDQLEYADALGFDGIGVNEHHQNGYRLMPSPHIIAAGLCRRTSRAAICV